MPRRAKWHGNQAAGVGWRGGSVISRGMAKRNPLGQRAPPHTSQPPTSVPAASLLPTPSPHPPKGRLHRLSYRHRRPPRLPGRPLRERVVQNTGPQRPPTARLGLRPRLDRPVRVHGLRFLGGVGGRRVQRVREREHGLKERRERALPTTPIPIFLTLSLKKKKKKKPTASSPCTAPSWPPTSCGRPPSSS